MVLRRQFLTMVNLFWQNGSYKSQMQRTEEVGSGKAVCKKKGGLVVIMAIIISSSYMPGTVPNA